MNKSMNKKLGDMSAENAVAMIKNFITPMDGKSSVVIRVDKPEAIQTLQAMFTEEELKHVRFELLGEDVDVGDLHPVAEA